MFHVFWKYLKLPNWEHTLLDPQPFDAVVFWALVTFSSELIHCLILTYIGAWNITLQYEQRAGKKSDALQEILL